MNSEINKTESNDSEKNKKYELIPLDLDWMELAMNEPLPEVKPMDDDEDEEEIPNYIEEVKTENDSITGFLNHGVAPKKDVTDYDPEESLGCYSLKTPIKSQIVYTSLPSESSRKLDSKKNKESSDFSMRKLSLYTPVKHSLMETPIDHLNKALPNRNTTGPIETPVNHLRVNLLPTHSSQGKKSIFRTPIQPGSLIKPREPISTSLIPQRHIETKFTKLVVKGTTYLILKTLGKGGSSIVYQCFDCVNKANRAIKCVDLDSPSSQSFLKEIDCLKRLQHFDRVIKLYDHELSPKDKKLYFVMEMGSADLSQILKNLSLNNNEISPPYLILFYWMEMLQAVQQIHADGIIHSDLKPANFLLVDGKLKLIDFGISSSLSNDSTSIIKTVSEGTGNYISPEALNYEYSSSVSSPNYGKPKYKISFKSDVWSLGCILYQLVYKRTPFQHIKNPCRKLMAIANPDTTIGYPQEYKVPKKFVTTIRKCLKFDAKSRASIDELIAEYKYFDV